MIFFFFTFKPSSSRFINLKNNPMGVKINRKIKPKIIGLIIVAKIIPNFIHNLFKIKR